MSEKLDIVIFGASGFTGKHTISVLHKMIDLYAPHLKFGIAGRSETKLRQALKFAEQETGVSLSHIPIIQAHIENEESLHNLAYKTRILINCCGPYLLYGEPVVKACLQQGTHYLDVTAEPQFVAAITLNYAEEAKKRQLYIVHACGFDCIPIDLGVVFLDKSFGGTLNSVETYMKVWNDEDKRFGPAINRGTWDSAIEGVSQVWKIRGLYGKLFPAEKNIELSPKLSIRWLPHRNVHAKGYSLIFPTADRMIVKQSQVYFHRTTNKRPVQIETYYSTRTILGFLLLLLGVAVFAVLSQFSCGRYLLLKYPRFFSGGFFDSNEPPEDILNAYRFSLTLCGKGWAKSGRHTDQMAMDKTVVARVSGRNPGYGITCMGLALCAIVIAMEKEKLPECGGVYTPGAAFANTSLVEKIHRHGVTFEILTENIKL